MTDATTVPARWLNRHEAAGYLRISVRQLDRMGLIRSNVGRRTLYDRDALDTYLTATRTTPAPRPAKITRAAIIVPVSLPSRRAKHRDAVAALMDDVRAILHVA